MADTRQAVTLKGNPIEIAGNELKVGDAAPDFSLQDNGLAEVTLASTAGKTRIIATIPSLDTPVCHEENQEIQRPCQRNVGCRCSGCEHGSTVWPKALVRG